MSVRKSFLLLVLAVLIFPGAASATVSVVLDHPATVPLGQEFEVTVRIVGDDPVNDPPAICAYTTYLGYDEDALEMTDFQIEPFFENSLPGFPVIYTPLGTVSSEGVSDPSLPGRFGSWDVADTYCLEPANCPPIYHPYDAATATFTFRALREGPILFRLPFSDCAPEEVCLNIVTDCDSLDEPTMDGPINPQIFVLTPVPTLNQYGMGFLIFAMAVGALRVMRKRHAA